MKAFSIGLLIITFCHVAFPQVYNFGTDGLSGLSKDQVEELMKEKLVVGFADVIKGEDKNKTIEAAVIFNNTLEATWKLLSRTEDQPLYLDDCKKIEVVSKKINQAVEVHTSGNWLINLEYGVIEYFDPANYSLHWVLDESRPDNSLTVMKGFWQLFSYGKNQTLLRYGNNVSLKNVPEFVENMLKKNGVKDAMASIKKYIDSGGTYRK